MYIKWKKKKWREKRDLKSWEMVRNQKKTIEEMKRNEVKKSWPEPGTRIFDRLKWFIGRLRRGWVWKLMVIVEVIWCFDEVLIIIIWIEMRGMTRTKVVKDMMSSEGEFRFEFWNQDWGGFELMIGDLGFEKLVWDLEIWFYGLSDDSDDDDEVGDQ